MMYIANDVLDFKVPNTQIFHTILIVDILCQHYTSLTILILTFVSTMVATPCLIHPRMNFRLMDLSSRCTKLTEINAVVCK